MKKVLNQDELIRNMQINSSLAIQNMNSTALEQAKNDFVKVKFIEIEEYRTTCFPVIALYKSISRIF